MELERHTRKSSQHPFPNQPSSTKKESQMSSSVQEIFRKQKLNHLKISQTTADERIRKILKLKKKILSRAEDLKKAIYQDFRKAPLEVDLSEIYSTVTEINFTVKNLKKW